MSRYAKPSTIRKLEKHEATWVAGILDSEGYIYWKPRKDSIDHIRVAITNTNLEFLTEIVKVSGGGIISCKDRKPNGRDCYDIVYRKNEMIDILPQIIPFLIIKKEKAIRALEELKRRG